MEKTTTKLFILSFEIGGTNIKVSGMEESDYKKNDIFKLDLNRSFNNSFTLNFKNSDDPLKTIKEICVEIKSKIENKNIQILKVGISSFGPVGIDKNRLDFGFILITPKKGWSNFDLLSALADNLNVSKSIFSIETDVNAAAKLEFESGNHFRISNNTDKKITSLAYITIGTGCGVGIIIDGKLIHGLQHPEGGHIFVKRHLKDNYKGCCSIHGDCVEGLITNHSLKERRNLKSVDDLEFLSDDDEIWDFFSYYLAQLCLNLLYTVSIEKIIIGGGIVNRECLLPKVRKYFTDFNNGYILNESLSEENINSFIVRTEFKNDCGLLSGFAINY